MPILNVEHFLDAMLASLLLQVSLMCLTSHSAPGFLSADLDLVLNAHG